MSQTQDTDTKIDPQSIPPELRYYADKIAENVSTLADDYIGIQEKARNGEQISADDFLAAEKKYEQATEALYTRLDTAFNNVKGAMDRGQYNTLVDHVFDYAHQKIDEVNDKAGGDLIEEGSPLFSAFRRQVLRHADHKEDLKHISTESEQALVASTLDNNRGFAVAETHTEKESLDFITRNMKNLKDSGVDTIYLESDPAESKKISELSDGELKQLIETRRHKDITLSSAEEVAKAFNSDQSDDVALAKAKMFLAAKEQGIRVVPIDSFPDTTGMEGDLEDNVRIGRTNFTWTHEIEADRKQLHPEGDTGKFIVRGGRAHFTTENDELLERYDLKSRISGLVDEGLGIPVVDFESRENDHSIRRGKSPHGADFYLDGGENYNDVDTARGVKAADRADRRTAIAIVKETVPGFAEAINEKTVRAIAAMEIPGLSEAMQQFKKSGVSFPTDGNLSPSENAPPDHAPATNSLQQRQSPDR